MGRLSHQVKPHCEATFPRIITGVIYLSVKNAREPKRTPEAKKKAMEAPTDLYESTFSSLVPTSHVNLVLDIKVINS
jgi:hypothetical protein